LTRTIIKREWESENMAWRFYFNISTESFYIAVTLAGVDLEFHIHNLRSVIYDSSEETKNET